MAVDIRSEAAKYYDLNPEVPDDIPFYKGLMPSPDCAVLELGCGTGRVLVPLVHCCAYIHGIDLSEAMTSRCREKLRHDRIPVRKAHVQVGDITSFDLGRKFDLIIAPFRVFQNLETDKEVGGFFDGVQRHLSPKGTCILNVFNPKRDLEAMRRGWCVEGEIFSWEVPIKGGRVTCHDVRKRMDPGKLILYPELIYRRYEDDALKDEVVLRIVMRCYYSQQFGQLIVDHGFKLINRWGGYAGEPYGQGPELIIQFTQED